MVTTITNVSETSVYSGQPVEIEASLLNDSGSTATIDDLLLEAPLGTVCQLVRNGELPTTLANGATLKVPFTATFKAQAAQWPQTTVYSTFEVTAVAKTRVGSTYAETASAPVTVNAISSAYPNAANIHGPTMENGNLNLTSKRRSFLIPFLF